MSRLLEFFLGSILITVFTIAFMFFSALHYILRGGSVADCLWQASVMTWVDTNGDGRVNDGEPPLGQVDIHVDDVQTQLMSLSWPARTDKDGDTQLNISIPGCVDTIFEIYVETPGGYRLTTKPRIEINPELWRSAARDRVYYFGFILDR
jgi:hypothetical protein